MKDELKPIVEGLLKKSEENKVAWVHASTLGTLTQEEEIAPSSEDYAVSTSSYTINIFRYSGMTNNTTKSIRINILNELGDVVTRDEIRDDELEYPVMNKLLSLARKYVLGEDRVLKKIVESLNKPGVFGSTEDELPPF